jgi:hypothetical protein
MRIVTAPCGFQILDVSLLLRPEICREASSTESISASHGSILDPEACLEYATAKVTTFEALSTEAQNDISRTLLPHLLGPAWV